MNAPAVLPVGELPSTTGISVGVGGALTVDNTVVPPTTTIASPLSYSSALACADLSVAVLSAASGGLSIAGSVSCGTSSVTCGALSSTSVLSAGDILAPRYYLRVIMTSTTFAAANNVATALQWGALDTAGGGSSNWGPVSFPFTQVTIPAPGMYLMCYAVTAVANAAGIRMGWIEVNNAASPGTGRRYVESSQAAGSFTEGTACGGGIYQFAAGDTVQVVYFQSSGGNLTFQVTPGGIRTTNLQLRRLG